MSTCNLNSFVGTVNVHTHTDSRTHVPHDSLCLRVREGLQTAPHLEKQRGSHLEVKDAKLTTNRRVSMPIWG